MAGFRFHVDPASAVPIYRQLVDQVRAAVAGGILAEGDQLPSVRDVAISSAINPNTVAKAYTELERIGLIATLRGRGTFVSGTPAGPEPLPARLGRLGPEVDRLIVSAHHLDIDGHELLKLVRQRLETFGAGGRDQS